MRVTSTNLILSTELLSLDGEQNRTLPEKTLSPSSTVNDDSMDAQVDSGLCCLAFGARTLTTMKKLTKFPAKEDGVGEVLCV